MKYLWAAHKKGDLEKIGFEPSGDPETFAEEVQQFALQNYDAGWVMLAPTSRGVIPVGATFGMVAGPMMLIGDFTWFSWASGRNILEATATFFRVTREKMVSIMYVGSKDSDYANYLKDVGLIRPVGKLHDVMDEPVTLFQTKRAQPWAN